MGCVAMLCNALEYISMRFDVLRCVYVLLYVVMRCDGGFWVGTHMEWYENSIPTLHTSLSLTLESWLL